VHDDLWHACREVGKLGARELTVGFNQYIVLRQGCLFEGGVCKTVIYMFVGDKTKVEIMEDEKYSAFGKSLCT
jgi:hypothetical protein